METDSERHRQLRAAISVLNAADHVGHLRHEVRDDDEIDRYGALMNSFIEQGRALLPPAPEYPKTVKITINGIECPLHIY